MSKVVFSVRIEPELVRAAERVAALTHRTTSGLLSYALELYLRKNYPAALDPGARLVLVLDEAPDATGEAGNG